MNMGLATDIGNPNFVGATNPDSVLFVKFFDKPEQNNFKTAAEGRPIMEMVTMIHIETPGNQLSIIERRAHDGDKARFPLQWAHYENTKGKDGEQIQGTLLSDWPILNAAQVEELKFFKFRTVEQVANASDQQINSVGMIAGMSPHGFREKAKLFLAAAKDTAFVSKQDDLIKQQAEAMKKQADEMAEMKAQLAALTAAQTSKKSAKEKEAVI